MTTSRRSGSATGTTSTRGSTSAWLSAVIRRWETDAAVLEHLDVVANDLCQVRGDRLVAPYLPYDDVDWTPGDRERTVRHTAAVKFAVDAAGTPIRFPDLIARVCEAFPTAGAAVAGRMVAGLVEQDVLLTDLHPSTIAADPLDHVLERLPPDHPGQAALTRVRSQLVEYGATAPGRGRDKLREVAGTMRALHATDRPVQVDLAMDADVVLPRAVAEELEQAASTAWQLVPAATDPLAEYRAAFIERYGFGVAVPLRELLDPHAGLGPPRHYLSAEPTLPVGGEARDLIVCELAQRATMRGAREIVVDDELVERLAQEGAGAGFVEVCAQLLAGSEADLRAGDFLLVTSPYTHRHRPGSLSGRFLGFLPELGTAIGEVANELGAAPVQLMTRLGHVRDLNVVQVPQLTERTVRMGVFADRSRADVLGVDDLAIGAHPGRLFVLSTADGTEVVPELFNSLNVMLRVPHVARLLCDIGEARMPRWPLWSWGSAGRLPYLPRVRCGRTILASARWRPAPRLADAEPGFDSWVRAFEEWRREWAVPDVVDAAILDQRIRLDLGSGLHLRTLRDELRRHPDLRLFEEPAGGEVGTGWSGGHATEVVVTLLPGAVQAPVQAPVVAPASAHQPGGEWLFEDLRHGAPPRRADLPAAADPARTGRTGRGSLVFHALSG